MAQNLQVIAEIQSLLGRELICAKNYCRKKKKKKLFWTEQILPGGWLHGFLLMSGKVQVKFAEGDISAKPLDESQVLNLKRLSYCLQSIYQSRMEDTSLQIYSLISL